MYDNLLANVSTDLYIGGKWRKSSDNQRFDVIDPATERTIASVASASVEDAKAAVDANAEVHGMSVFGDLKYPADFEHFDYVNPDAPKGGVFSFIPSVRAYNQSYFTFSSLNAYILKGEGAQGMDMTFAGFPIGRVRQVGLGKDGKVNILVDIAQNDAKWLRTTSVFTLATFLS